MSLKSQLLRFLLRIPNMQTVPQRKALLTLIGFDYLSHQLTWEGSNTVFFNGLIELLCSEGKISMENFLREIADRNLNLVGSEDSEKLIAFANDVANLNQDQWNQECFGPPNPPIIKPPPPKLSKQELLDTLCKIIPSQFNQLIFRLQIPNHLFPNPNVPQVDRAIALLNWAESPTGCGLAQVEEALTQI